MSIAYDRAILAPAADFNWSTNALRETFGARVWCVENK